MEEELNYASVVFQNGQERPKAVAQTKEEATVYAQVKMRKPAAPDAKADGPVKHFRVLVVLFGIICVLLVAGIIGIVLLSIKLSKQDSDLAELTGQKEQLSSQKAEAEQQREEFRGERDQMTWMLNTILEFNNFPVSGFCPQKEIEKCSPCQDGWLLFQESCYLIYNDTIKPNPWMAWKKSREFCQQQSADLVVIKTLQEQEFLRTRIEYYYDKHHGFWIGLQDVSKDGTWVWVDGTNDTLKYWDGGSGQFALMIPDKNVTQNWAKADNLMRNKFICERRSLTHK
ncbi:oxidized low-density lipoprotein receptor 1-like [Genypterus blacodes]|uniref:oxidized low-density lipoprotein receptor 1-like n=1 Tax=Genypterus blacodes TaxID=154954 RepID=UPI003F75DE40